mmetsp:Transcript_70401/g.138238  ORF Transcript_70401/g.138238 Transcript_70401/m.138238 type:complete len:590 (+) Transcript_70401:48-1817(+)
MTLISGRFFVSSYRNYYQRTFRIKRISFSTGNSLNFSDVLRTPEYASTPALVEGKFKLTYAQLDYIASKTASVIAEADRKSRFSAVGAFNKPSISFVVSMLAAWKLGKVFVPLSTNHSENELNYFVEDSKVGLICCTKRDEINPAFVNTAKLPFLETDSFIKAISNVPKTTAGEAQQSLRGEDCLSGSVNGDTGALVIYTSGTTGRPKGVLHTHSSLFHMTQGLIESWKYTANDKILHFLPLYHVHGLVNKLLCVLKVGGTVEFLASANAPVIWNRLAEEEVSYQKHRNAVEAGNSSPYKPVSLFMAVPTIYARLLESSTEMRSNPETSLTLSDGVSALKRMRLMVSGSAALPDTVLNNWKNLTGYKLLERYGMTEIGMALSNPYEGERKEGYVGFPLPGVECKLVDDRENTISEPNTPGELRIKGPQVFSHYLNRPDATKETFDAEGWFKTGDVAEVGADGFYKILGRNSTDIIKSAGYKLSALEIERELLAHPQILEAAVVGVSDDVLGEKVLAVISLRTGTGSGSSPGDLVSVRGDATALQKYIRVFLEDKLAHYKQPRDYVVVDAIPRNHLGKVNKKSLLKDLNI